MPSNQTKIEVEENGAEDFQDAGNVNEVSRQTVLHEEVLHLRAGVRQLRITVGEENQSEREAKDQQSQRLKGIERLHEGSSAFSFQEFASNASEF